MCIESHFPHLKPNLAMFKRSIIKQLEQWKDKPDRKPLMLLGARQVGKTFVQKQFKDGDIYWPISIMKVPVILLNYNSSADCCKCVADLKRQATTSACAIPLKF